MRIHNFKEDKDKLIEIPLSDGIIIVIHTYTCSSCGNYYCMSDDKSISWHGGKPPDEDCNIEIFKKVHEA